MVWRAPSRESTPIPDRSPFDRVLAALLVKRDRPGAAAAWRKLLRLLRLQHRCRRGEAGDHPRGLWSGMDAPTSTGVAGVHGTDAKSRGGFADRAVRQGPRPRRHAATGDDALAANLDGLRRPRSKPQVVDVLPHCGLPERGASGNEPDPEGLLHAGRTRERRNNGGKERHRFARRHPAARACASEQNQRSPFEVSMRVLAYHCPPGTW